MSQMFGQLALWKVREYISAAIRGEGGDYMAAGSENAMANGLDFTRAFRGMLAIAGRVGSRLFFNTDGSYAGLGTAAANGSGNVFVVKQLLAFVGAGQVNFGGLVLAGVVASSTLSYIRKIAGAYSTAVIYQAGHAQPSAPTIYAKSNVSPGKEGMTGTVAVVIWRGSSLDGQPSLKSLPSNTLILTAQSCIVQMPLADTNNQDFWGIGVPKVEFAELGVMYELPTSLGGEVLESYLSKSRTVTGASILITTNVVDITDPDVADRFTSADIGRRIAFGGFDSWITGINSPTQATVNDTAGAGYAGTATVTHAIDGITRAVEISWTNGALVGQAIAPDKAFPPDFAAEAGGILNDTLFLEAENIIYIGEPGYIGSFPRSNALFPPEPAIRYLRGEGVYWRFGRTLTGALVYVGGSPAIEYQNVWENIGIKYAQNAALGWGGRLIMWSGKPYLMRVGIDPDSTFADRVMPDFEGWSEGQTAAKPIVAGFDPAGLYEVWCWGKKIMAYRAPSDQWCAPADISAEVTGDIVAAVATEDKRLLIACLNGVGPLNLYQYDAGTGTVMIVQTSDMNLNGSDATVNDVYVQGRMDNAAHPVKIEIVKNYRDAAGVVVHNVAVADAEVTTNGKPFVIRKRPNIVNVKQLAARVTIETEGGNAGVDKIIVGGASSNCFTG